MWLAATEQMLCRAPPSCSPMPCWRPRGMAPTPYCWRTATVVHAEVSDDHRTPPGTQLLRHRVQKCATVRCAVLCGRRDGPDEHGQAGHGILQVLALVRHPELVRRLQDGRWVICLPGAVGSRGKGLGRAFQGYRVSSPLALCCCLATDCCL